MLTLYVNVQCYKLNREKEGEIERGERGGEIILFGMI